MARQSGWSLSLRIEDIDHPRVKPETIDLTREDLQWLGLDWDEEAPLQSTELAPCRAALQTLGSDGRIFRCDLTRNEVQRAQSAPHDRDSGLRFEPHLRPPEAGRAIEHPQEDVTWRMLVTDQLIHVEDRFAGPSSWSLASTCGDFPVWTKAGPSYQLAVAVDDARQGITQVVRGDDLLPSAARQQALQDALGLRRPTWWHLPLVRGRDGRRLAKRHGDTRLAHFRDIGATPERVIGLLAWWSGVPMDARVDISAAEFLECFDITRVPPQDITLSTEDLAWLAG